MRKVPEKFGASVEKQRDGGKEKKEAISEIKGVRDVTVNVKNGRQTLLEFTSVAFVLCNTG